MIGEPSMRSRAIAGWDRRFSRAVVTFFVLGALYVAVALLLAWGPARGVTGWKAVRALPLVLSLVFLGDALRGLRWLYYGAQLGWTLPWGQSLCAFFASFSLTATPGKAGELLKCALLSSRYRIPVSQSAAVLIVERLGDLAAVLAISLAGLAGIASARSFVIVAAVLCVAATLVLSQPKLVLRALAPLLSLSLLKGTSARVEAGVTTVAILLKPTQIAVALSLAIVAWSIEALALAVLLRAFGVQVALAHTFSTFGTSTIAGALSMMPGGIGGVEATMLAMLAGAGIDLAQAGAIVAVFRLCTLWFGSALGFAFLGVWFAGAKPTVGADVAP